MGCGTVVFILLLGLIVFAIVGQNRDKSDSHKQAEPYSRNKQPLPERSKALSADQLMNSCIIQYDSSIRMGAHASEYLGRLEYLNREIVVKGTIFTISTPTTETQTRIDFSVGPCIAPGGNLIRCYITESEVGKGPGEIATVSGTLTAYGKLPMEREESLGGCGYYVELHDCKIIH